MRQLLSPSEVETALASLSGWERVGDELVKTYAKPSFADAIAFVVQIGFLAEAADHHPDLDVRYRNVRVALTTHDQGGITNLDVDVAARIEAIGAA